MTIIERLRFLASGQDDPHSTAIGEAADELERLTAEREKLQVQLAGCGVAALQNTPDSIVNRAKPDDYGYSESYAEVCRAVDREIALRAERDTLLDALKRLAFHAMTSGGTAGPDPALIAAVHAVTKVWEPIDAARKEQKP